MRINIDLFDIWRPRDINICSAISNKNKIGLVYIPNNNILSTEISIHKNYSDIIKKYHKNSYIKKKIKIFTFEKIIKNFKINLKQFDNKKNRNQNDIALFNKKILNIFMNPNVLVLSNDMFKKLLY